jgi:TPP-dependent 2-oxoacid decarboxylase
MIHEPKELVVVRADVGKLLKSADKLVIEDKVSMLTANELLVDVKRKSKILKQQKDKMTKPMNEALKAVRSLFKPVEDELGQITRILTDGIVTVKRRLDEEARQAEQKILEDKRITRVDTTMRKMSEIDTPDNQMFAEHGSSNFSEVKVLIIDDIKLIPIKYFERPNVVEALLIELRRDAMGNKAQGIEPIEIPGTHIESEERLSTRV